MHPAIACNCKQMQACLAAVAAAAAALVFSYCSMQLHGLTPASSMCVVCEALWEGARGGSTMPRLACYVHGTLCHHWLSVACAYGVTNLTYCPFVMSWHAGQLGSLCAAILHITFIVDTCISVHLHTCPLEVCKARASYAWTST